MQRFVSNQLTRLFLVLTLSPIIFVMFGCVSTTQTRIRPGVTLNRFGYVYVAPPVYSDGSIDKYGIGSKLSIMFSNIGLQVLSETEAKNFPKSKLGQILYCRIQHFHSPVAGGLGGSYATVIIDCYDAFNRQIYYGVGKYQGMTISDDLNGALKRAFQGFVEKYTGFDPILAEAVNEEIKQQYANWEKINLNKEQLMNYYNKNIDNLDPIEGIWSSFDTNVNYYQIGIIKDQKSSKRDFVGIIIESEIPHWQPKQVKIEFQRTAYNSVYSTTYYLADHSEQKTTAFIDENGILKIMLKNLRTGKTIENKFIKNYPKFMRTEISSSKHPSKPILKLEGTGFLLAKSGLVVTNYHVIKSKSDIEVIFPQISRTFKAKLTLKDASNDIAILRLTDFNFSNIFNINIPYTITSSNTLKLGQEVFTLGFPLGEILGKSAKVSIGRINSLYGIQDDPRLIQISNPVQPGNSGGPLFNKNGELIGIVLAALNAKYFYEVIGIIPQNVNFAIKAEYLNSLISMLPESDEVTYRQNQLKGKTLEKQIELLTPFIVRIQAK